MNLRKINHRLEKRFSGRVTAALRDGAMVLTGNVDTWAEVVEACGLAAERYSKVHVVNDLVCAEAQPQKMRLPKVTDDTLEGRRPDVLIIGGGISGASIARELSKWKLDILLVEKEADLALQASGRNDGEVHPGIDLKKGSKKHAYVRKGNAMYDQVCQELDVPFRRVGQYVCFQNGWFRPFAALYCLLRKYRDGISDTKIISARELYRREPEFTPGFQFAIANPSAGCVCPYGLTIAYGENAVQNGVQVSLNTAVLEMEAKDGKILSAKTNRGRVYPGLVINAAGVFAEEVAAMAGDRFYSIHPRRGTNAILDKKAGTYVNAIASIKEITKNKSNTKGGGILHTVHDNLLVGPDAVETWEKENVETHAESIEKTFQKHQKTMPKLSQKDIITYFTGVRAPTFEEDFIIEMGRKTENLIHCAGIQSPGLTTAPAVALDVEKMAVDYLKKTKKVEKNPDYNPIRRGIPVLRDMSDEDRSALIRKNPDYGIIVCRCEEVSKGEILDALKSPICVPTVDGIKKRVRPGMGRCQGGFCSPLVTKIIADYLDEPLSQVKKSSEDSNITCGPIV